MFKRQDLIDLARTSMPFGKYQGLLLIDLPESYLLWLARSGLPEGRLGELLARALEIKTNGLDYLLHPLKLRADKEKAWRIRPTWQFSAGAPVPDKTPEPQES